MPGAKQRDLAKERRWRRLLEQQRSGGLSVRAFCRRHDVAEHSFYWWRRELAARPPAAEVGSRLVAAPRRLHFKATTDRRNLSVSPPVGGQRSPRRRIGAAICSGPRGAVAIHFGRR